MWGFELRRDIEIPLKRQIYLEIKEQIVAGRLRAGEALPSTRQLAEELKVSRNTVNEAFDMLLAEGFVVSRQGSPTRIADGAAVHTEKKEMPRQREHQGVSFLVDFRTGQPDLRSFPKYLWQQISIKASREMPDDMLGYTGPQGLPSLRYEISSWLYRSKGLAVDPLDIFITAGATHALSVIAHLLYQPEQAIIVEDPTNIEMLQSFINKGYDVKRVPVDECGLITDKLPSNSGPIYVTPSHQFPLGGILPADRRAALIRFARGQGSYIVEDDYDSEFRYDGDPVSPLYAMDPNRVIYIGTFSKVLFPALRIGYVILPHCLQKRWRYLRTHTDVQNPPFEQAALAEFLRTRKFDRHIRNMRKLYRERRQALMTALKRSFGDRWHPWGDAAGLHLAIEFENMRFDSSFKDKCRSNRIRITPVEYHAIAKGFHANKLLFGYGHLEPQQIEEGVAALKAFLLAQGYMPSARQVPL
ncbi:MocR-like pyridoxine biosynthesis transcription factor PdxR [Paenibacillus ihbetae]|uniref:GntR family transcriptional regulator n=1 Tax=Paenibacillus ihbetae TaxID=1870820 RepID=A0ABX3JWH9_9BACL|nr:PLP-dependent aminotransferase family protein [Paenibacillus ihbetae]OOC61154.1 GntR family transcriptional regulator [Paenibacillus ihbetae]